MGREKLLLDLDGRSLLSLTLASAAAAGLAEDVVIVCPRKRWTAVTAAAHAAGMTAPRLVEGGARRQDSVRAGLAACAERVDVVVVHDAARPLCPPAVFTAVVEAARRDGAATAAMPIVDTVKRIDAAGHVVATLDRTELVAVQTPQAFRRAILEDAHACAAAQGWRADDDCALVERAGILVSVVAGADENLKVTTAADLVRLRALLAARRGP